IAAAVAIVAVVVSMYLGPSAVNNPSAPTQQNASSSAPPGSATAPPVSVPNATTASVPVHNATGRHFSVNLDESVGIKQK
ncbi:MAG TPA: hypothetical protein VJ792_07660, partial [Candidatus Nitrosotalea sp.]|nr:hypothetical protein [Candidatus Nitrosotalea sp.]